MTVHHTVLLNFKQDVTEAQIAEFADGVQTYLTGSVPGVTQSHFMRRRTPKAHGDSTLPFTHLLMTDTPDEVAWQRYIDAPLHDEFVVKFFRPLVRHYQVAIYLED